MTATPSNIIPAKYAENSATTQYTSTLCKTIIDRFSVTNVTGSNATISVNVLTSGDVVGDDNLFIDTRTIAPGESYPCPQLIGHIMESGDSINTTAGTASALVISASGRKIT